MTARSEVTPELIERLLPAYRRLLRMARENQAAADSPPGAYKERAARTNAAPMSDVQPSDLEVTACLPPS